MSDNLENVKTYLNHKGYGILRKELTDEQEKILKEELTVKPNVIPDYDFGNNKSYPVYRMNSTRYYVPKHWGIKKYGPPELAKEREGKHVDYQFNGELRPHQVKFSDMIYKELHKNDRCIGCMTTGGGKTVVSLWIMAQLKKKTLILVHKQFLLDQWVERIKQFLPNVSIGVIQQNKCETHTDISIGMIQSVTSRTYPPGTFDEYGVCLIDEIHHLASQTFSKIPFKVATKKMLGLSATPKRKDGLTKVIEWHLGNIIVNHKKSDIEVPTLKFVEAKYSGNLQPKYNWKGKLITANMVTQISEDSGRTKQIVDEIITWHEKGRKILVLTDRRAHCLTMERMLNEEEFKGTVGLYLGGMKEAQLTENNKSDVILATYSMAYEGYDNPGLDTLIMATGRGDVEQACGRVLRRKNKFNPLIIDFTDPLYFGGQVNRRKKFYKKKGYLQYGSNKIIGSTSKNIQIEDEPMFI